MSLADTSSLPLYEEQDHERYHCHRAAQEGLGLRPYESIALGPGLDDRDVTVEIYVPFEP